MIGARLSSLSVVWEKEEYRAFLLVMVLASLGMSSSAPLLALYLVNHLHVALSLVGLFFASQAVPGFVLGILVGRWSDHWRSRLLSIRISLVWVGLGWLIFAFSPYWWLDLAVGVIFFSALGTIMGQVFAALHDVMTRDGETRPGLINMTVRTGWSFGFVFGPVLGTLLAAQAGFRTAFIATACLYLICLAPLHGLSVAVHSAVRGAHASNRGVRSNPLVFLFAGLCALVLCGNVIKNTYLPIDVTAHLGGSVRIYGTIMSVSPAVELVMMPLAGLLALRIPISRLIGIGLVVAMVEYLLLSSSSALWQLYAIQAMDAWVIAALMGLGLTYAQGLSPNLPGLASGAVTSSFGVSMVVGNLIGSATIPFLGVPHVFLIPAGLSTVALVIFLGIERVRVSRERAEDESPLSERRAIG